MTLIDEMISEDQYMEIMGLIDECLAMMGISRPNHFLLIKLNKFIISYYLYMAIDEARKVKNKDVLKKLKDAKLIN